MHAENSSLISFDRLNGQRTVRYYKNRENNTYTGKECPKGHTTRYTANDSCAECLRNNSRKSKYKAAYGARSRMVDIDHMLEGHSSEDPLTL